MVLKNNDTTTMAISNCLFSPTLEIPAEFPTWCVLAKFSAKPRNYSYTRPWRLIAQGLAVHDKISFTKGSCILGYYRNRMATLQNRF